MLPSLYRLARELKISVLTTTRAYNEPAGQRLFVISSGSNLICGQFVREVEINLTNAIESGQRISMTNDELVSLLHLLPAADND